MDKVRIKKLFNKLKKIKYSKKNRLKFRNLVHIIETKLAGKKNNTRGVFEYNLTPTEFFFRNKNGLSKKYLFGTNTNNTFTFRNFKLKKGIKFIPLHINNKIKNKTHLNLLVIKNKCVYRIEPSCPDDTKIKEKNVKKGLNKLFKKYSMKYCGFYKNSKIIKHGGLCRFVTPLEYFHKNINYYIIKREIINYFKYLMKKNKVY